LRDTEISGFSHTHLSGTGGDDLLDFLLMPGVGAVAQTPAGQPLPSAAYRAAFSHTDETMRPGYYAVKLGGSGIQVELTATERAALHRYTFPAESDQAYVVLDLEHSVATEKEKILWSQLELKGADTVLGGRSTDLWAAGRQIYFALRFSRAWDAASLVAGEDRQAQSKAPTQKAVFRFKTKAGGKLLAKVGISSVSAQAALANLDAEIPGWDFDAVAKAAHEIWQRELGSIRIETADEEKKKIFYTGLYHALIAPTLFDDADGHYRGMDGKVHPLPTGEHNYSTYSLWDTYRSANPLYLLIQPHRACGMVTDLIRMAEESPAGPPVWPLHGKETGCMTGYHSVVVVAEALAKNLPGIDAARAWRAFRKRALEDNYRGLGYFRKLGYIPADKEEESASKTLDYAYDAWAAARLAQAAGANEDAALLRRQAGYYRNLWDASVGFIRPKLESGQWTTPFAPNEMGHDAKLWRDYTESNPWVTSFSVQHDPEGLARLLGGRKALSAKLDGLFTADPTLPPDAPPDIAGQVGQYAHGNEPGHHIAYLYAYTGDAWKTQARVRSLLDEQYTAKPDGLAGNEDCGQMSAWYILSALGFYPVDPVSANYVVTAPLFDRATLDLGQGHRLEIVAHRSSGKDIYIQSARLNGSPLTRAWFSHKQIAQGGRLEFVLGPEPNKSFGAADRDLPPSMEGIQIPS
jgi:predicted alpha-1,2-mannosidase